jgi:Flp pilus assembly pilin Flp
MKHSLRKHKKGQGMTEYVVILGLIIALAVGVVWKKFGPALQTKVDSIANMVST